jgi:hypothetical protein
MALVKLFESSHVAIGGFLRQLIICGLRCLGFGCGHVLVYSGKLGKIPRFRLVWHESHASASFKGAALFPLVARVGMRFGGSIPSNAAVMRRFTRVVALPDPKNSDFPSRINTFLRLGCRIGDRWAW